MHYSSVLFGIRFQGTITLIGKSRFLTGLLTSNLSWGGVVCSMSSEASKFFPQHRLLHLRWFKVLYRYRRTINNVPPVPVDNKVVLRSIYLFSTILFLVEGNMTLGLHVRVPADALVRNATLALNLE
jgi:hypothetical protein